MKTRKVPMRKCVASQEMFPKKELIRVVRTPDGEVQIDPTGKQSGRGAYLRAEADYVEMAKKRKALERALKMKVNDELYDELHAFIAKGKLNG
ncbi:RNase P modulator RnpM [Marininema halotolerans]|uniref:RNase P modulator RnpM n=1 Tax=Marininema halotolerans TaxID=1155944 RepID=UPI000B883FCA|nr:YlxR family protein [Marininema halotolerans]